MKPALLILAAGMGSRYGGIKQIDSVGKYGETLLDYSCFDARRNGYDKVVFVIRKDIEKDFRERLFNRIAANMDASYVFQSKDSLLSPKQSEKASAREKPWGTIHAVLCAAPEIKSPFTIINADDYYGSTAFNILSSTLSPLPNNSTEYAMVGYILKNTMSLSGSVSRGICEVSEDRYLKTLRENKNIEFDAKGIVSHFPEGDIRLSGEEIVSMNFFGFTPAAFDYFNGYWEKFIEKNASDLKAECLLPDCAGEIVTTGAGTIKVFSSPDKWFGMTYREDRETVHNNLVRKTEEGLYPEKLWDKT